MLKRALLVALAVIVAGIIILFAIFKVSEYRQSAARDITASQGARPEIDAPRSGLFPLVKVAKPIGWGADQAPAAAPGLKVQRFASGLDHPRWMLPLPNGDVLVAETNAPKRPASTMSLKERARRWVMSWVGANTPSANRITLLRDADGDGIAESRSVLIDGLVSPFGMALVGDQLYIGNADALVRVPFAVGQTRVTAKPVKVVDLPSVINYHWTKNVVASPDGKRLFVTVGSNSNVGENGLNAEKGRAAIWEIDPTTGNHRIYAYGLRNPNGMAWEPTTKQLWTVVNERDELGSDIVPDYLTSVQFGGFYGWPWYYWGGYVDSRPGEDPDNLQSYVIRPDYALGAHTASLGLTFTDKAKLGPRFAQGAIIGQHGSWNRKPPSGYKVVFVPFRGGKPQDKPVDLLTGFLTEDGEAHGRPVGTEIDRTGALLVADDVGNVIWRVSAR
ncbi:PQQ-dependent sugar dehydrogenase [Sphingomonas sp.]|uniref:PQQ-dependent sugar dehydrogenase n=1 Tax=Sphingomonas sp. TaxID=28214 RepID=UPI003B3A408B